MTGYAADCPSGGRGEATVNNMAEHHDRGAVVGSDLTHLAATLPRCRIDSAMVKEIARVFQLRKLPETGVYATIQEIAAVDNIITSYVSRVLRLILLTSKNVGRERTSLVLRSLQNRNHLLVAAPLGMLQRRNAFAVGDRLLGPSRNQRLHDRHVSSAAVTKNHRLHQGCPA